MILWHFHWHCLEQPAMVIVFEGLRSFGIELWKEYGGHTGAYMVWTAGA
jgi:hypothetical protein